MGHATARVPQARFFFALRPDPAAASVLAALAERLAARYGGRPLAGHDIHLTLAFLGMRPIGDAPMLAGFLVDLPCADLEDSLPVNASRPLASGALALSRLGTFGRGIIWAGPADETDAAQETHDTQNGTGFACRLAAQLRARLREARIGFDDRPLRLHATLVRGAGRLQRDDADRLATALPVVPAHWRVAIGWSDASSTAQRRYRWQEVPHRSAGTGSDPTVKAWAPAS